MEACYSVMGANVVRETFDQEVVIVNLETGNYYSLEGIAGVLWTLLEDGATEAQLSSELLARYQADEATVARNLQTFLTSLVDEKLVNRTANPPGAVLSQAPDSKLPYAAPALAKFTDMQDLLLLDPIHDVDEAGWPLRANGDA